MDLTFCVPTANDPDTSGWAAADTDNVMGKDSINKISDLVEEEVCIDGKVLENGGDVMSRGILVLTIQDSPDCQPLLVIPATVMSRARCD